MDQVWERLRQVQQATAEWREFENEEGAEPEDAEPEDADRALQRAWQAYEDREEMVMRSSGGLFQIEFHGTPWNEPFEQMLAVLGERDVAARLLSLRFHGPDQGANGTCEWDFSPLLGRDVLFPSLLSLCVEPLPPGSHNQAIIGHVYEEGGQIAAWLDKSPRLQVLTVPSAPGASFFDRAEHSLQSLHAEAGYDAQNFVLNLARSTCLPNLSALDWSDYRPPGSDCWGVPPILFEHYQALLGSRALDGVRSLALRNVRCTPEQEAALRASRPLSRFTMTRDF